MENPGRPESGHAAATQTGNHNSNLRSNRKGFPMLFATMDFGTWLAAMIGILAFIGLRTGKLLSKLDSDGAVKKAAQDVAIRGLSKFFK